MIASAGRLLERDRELQRIGSLLDGAVNGAGSLIVIEGPAGIGKTRLSRAARQDAESRGFLTLAARGAELEHDYAFGVVRQLLEPTLRAASPQERKRLLDGAAALAAPAVLPEASLAETALDPAFGALHGLYWLCANLAEPNPLLLVVDDVHWADERSLRFLGFLANRLEALPVVVLLTRRAGAGATGGVTDDPGAERLQLRPLSEGAVASFFRLLTNDAPDVHFVAACHEATGGNPFLLDQVAQTLLERNLSFTADSVDLVEAVAPAAVSAALLARLARLGPAPTALARATAVLGDDTPLALAAELAGLDERAGAEAAADLAGAGVFEDMRPLRFEHPIVGSAVGAGLSATETVALHRQAAALLSRHGAAAGEVALHLLPTDARGGDAWLVETLAAAADEAIARGAPAAAVPMLARALEEPPPPERRFELLLALGRAESVIGRPEASNHLRDAHAEATDPLERARAALALAWSNARGRLDGQPLAELVLEAIDAATPIDRELALELEAAHAALVAADTTHPSSSRDRLERFADIGGGTRAECALLAHLAHARLDAAVPAQETVAVAERAVANERVVAEASFDAPWLLSAVIVLRHADRYETALRVLDLTLAAAARRGSIPGFALGCALKGSVLMRSGAVDEAEAELRAGLDAAPHGSWARLPAVGTLVEVLVERGALDEAKSILVEAGADGEIPDLRPATVLLLSRAALSHARGDFAAALADLEDGRARLDRFGARNVVGLDGRIRTALVRHALGQAEAARREADAALTVARRWGTPGAIGGALRVRGLLAPPHEGLDLLHDAVEHLRRSPQRLEHARALVDLGAALRRRGDRAAAREPLRQALDLAHACGGLAVAASAHEELTATGARVRRDARSGIESLTPSERRIVERAAMGASNREIAQALFITVKTVEMHLGHAYRKLGISSRSDLVAHLTP